MIDFFDTVTLASGWLITTLIFLFYPKCEEQNFIRLAMFFVGLFYLVPGTMFLVSDDLVYANRYLGHSASSMSFAMICLLFFLMGFMAKDIARISQIGGIQHSQGPTVNGEHTRDINRNRVLVILLAGFSLSILARFVGPDSESLYEVRRSAIEGSHVLALLSITSNALMFSAFFLCIRAEWRFLALLCISLILANYLDGSPGRVTLGLALLVFAIFLFRLSARLIIMAMPAMLLVLLPAVINGKTIIYQLVVLGELPSFAAIFDYSTVEIHSLFGNLAHPFVSVVFVHEMIEKVGIRLFFDYIQGVVFYARLIGLDFGPSLTYYNSELFTGRLESIVPTGYLAFGYAQGLLLGVFVSGLFYRFTFGIIRRTAIYRVARSREADFYLAFLAAGTFYSGEVRTMVLGFFLPVLILHLSCLLCTKQ